MAQGQPFPFWRCVSVICLVRFLALLFQSEFAVSDLDSLSSPFVTSFSKRSPEISNRQLSGINSQGPSEKDQNTSILCCDHCTLKAHTSRSPFGNPGTTLVPYVGKSLPGTISPGNVFILPTIPQYQVASPGLSFGGLDLGLCQGCHHVYGQNQKKVRSSQIMLPLDIIAKKTNYGIKNYRMVHMGPWTLRFNLRARAWEGESLTAINLAFWDELPISHACLCSRDPGGSNGLKSSTSDGYLSRNTRSHSLPRDSYDDFDMRVGLTELTGTVR